MITIAFILLRVGSTMWLGPHGFRVRRPRPTACPVCGYAGGVTWYGRYRCSSCGGAFVLSLLRRRAQSIYAVLALDVCLWAVIGSWLVHAWISHDEPFIYLPAVLVAEFLIALYWTVRPKRFPDPAA